MGVDDECRCRTGRSCYVDKEFKAMTNEERLRLAILEVLEHGDQDEQPWAFYAHDHGGLKGYDWTDENAMTERINFAHAVVVKVREL